MCLLACALHSHPDYKLVVAANRDERYTRPTFYADWWADNDYVLGGRDAEAGGTWLAITRQGKIAALTNYWGAGNGDENAPSRGTIIQHYLTGRTLPEDYADILESQGHRYNGFNLVFGTVDKLFYYNNVRNTEDEVSGAENTGKGDEGAVRSLDVGLYAIANAGLDTPWPKVETVKHEMKQILDTAGGAEWHEEVERHEEVKRIETSLMELLGRIEKPERQRTPSLSLEERQGLAESSLRIRFPSFGTLSSTVIIVDKNDRVHFAERNYFPEKYHTYDFVITPPK